MLDLVDLIEHKKIELNNLNRQELTNFYHKLNNLRSEVSKVFISKLKSGEKLSYEEISIIQDDLYLEEPQSLDNEVGIIDLIIDKALNNEIQLNPFFSFPFELYIELYQKAIDTIIEKNSYEDSFDFNLGFLAEHCCKSIQKICTEKHKYNYFEYATRCLEKLASLYVKHIEYIREYNSIGYSNEDYTSWYENVLQIDPNNSSALKWLLWIKEEQLNNEGIIPD